MNSPDDADAAAAAAGPWCCYNDNAGEATAAAALPTRATTGESGGFFADMVPDYSTDDLFELVWEQEGKTGGGVLVPAVSCLWSPRFSSKPPDDVPFDPPSEDEMAAWLSNIVKGEELACNNDDDGRLTTDDGRRDVVPATTGTSTVTDNKEKVPTTTTERMMMGNNKEMRKAPAGGSRSSRRSHHGEAHNMTEKRRRHKINERLKTLQQLVPGCSKSNQASTLDQTIHYMKTLQHQVQAMSVGLPAAPAVYPVVLPQRLPPGTPVALPSPAAPMVPFGTIMLQLPAHYPAAAVMMPLYPAAAPTSTAASAVAPGSGPGDAMSANHLHGSSRVKERAVAACARVTLPEHYQNTRYIYDVETPRREPHQEGSQIVDDVCQI